MFGFLFFILCLIYLGFDTVANMVADGIKFLARVFSRKKD